MNWNKFKNNKVTVTIGNLLPIILIFLFWYIDIPEGYIGFNVLRVVLSVLIGIFYVVCLIPDVREIIRFFPFKSKMIYSEYGTYFLIKRKKISDRYLEFDIFTNKYFFFLSVIDKENDVLTIYKNDLNNLNEGISRQLEKKYENILHKNQLKKTIKDWDGITDDVTRREKVIDEAIK
tara:strand:- start:16716 stop:17246 length:531 start_codon:yes stop_codon:yes gene_type:complete